MIKRSSIYSPFICVIPPSAIKLDDFVKWYSYDYLKSIEDSFFFSVKNGRLISFKETIFGQGGQLTATLKVIDPDGSFYRTYLENEYADAVVRLCEETLQGSETAVIPSAERSVYIAYGADSSLDDISIKKYNIKSVFTYKDSNNAGITEVEFFIEYTDIEEITNRRNRTRGLFLGEDKTKSVFNVRSNNAILGTQGRVRNNSPQGVVIFSYTRTTELKSNLENLFEDVVRESLGITFDETGSKYDSYLVKFFIDPRVISYLNQFTIDDPPTTYLSDHLSTKLKDYGIQSSTIRGDDNVYLSFDPNWLPGEKNTRRAVVASLKKMYEDAGLSLEVDSLFLNELFDVKKFHDSLGEGTTQQVVLCVSDINKINQIIDEYMKDDVQAETFALENSISTGSLADSLKDIPLLVHNGPNSNVISLSQKKTAVEFFKLVGAGLLTDALLYKSVLNWTEYSTINDNYYNYLTADRAKVIELFEKAFADDEKFISIKNIIKNNLKNFNDIAENSIKTKGIEAINKLFDNFQKSGFEGFTIDPVGFTSFLALMKDLKNNALKYVVARTVPMPRFCKSVHGFRPAFLASREHFFSDGYNSVKTFDLNGDTYLSGLYKIRSITTMISSIECYTEFDLIQNITNENTIGQ